MRTCEGPVSGQVVEVCPPRSRTRTPGCIRAGTRSMSASWSASLVVYKMYDIKLTI